MNTTPTPALSADAYFGTTSLLGQYLNDNLPSALYSVPPTAEGLRAHAASRPYSAEQRATLVQVLREQYAALPPQPAVTANLDLLAQPDTYTVCTGHQLSVMGGPLFIAYKIAGIIKLASELSARGTAVVPVFWLASEDHDVDEITSLWLFGKSHRWPTTRRGAVGRIPLEDDFDQWLTTLPDLPAALRDLRKPGQTLADYTRALWHHWFGSEGLIILNPDDARLKAHFAPVMQRELETGFVAQGLTAGAQALQSAGHSAPLEVPAGRSVFYLSVEKRRRLVPTSAGYQLGNSGETIAADALAEAIGAHPEAFSPDVALRPVYQEATLPNLAYLGGPAEVAYWLQLKPVFEAAGVPQAAIMLRPHGTLVAPPVLKKASRLPLSLAQVITLPEADALALLKQDGPTAKDFGWVESNFAQLFDKLRGEVNSLDPALLTWLEAERARLSPQLEKITHKLNKRAEEATGAGPALYQFVREKLRPGGKPQERIDSVLGYYLNFPTLFIQLLEAVSPFDTAHLVITLSTHDQVRTKETSAALSPQS